MQPRKSFASSETGFDSLTGESKESKINFTSTDPAQNYDFFNQSVTLKPQSFNLDVDGDGKVTALGDGLMVIRKLFGAALPAMHLLLKLFLIVRQEQQQKYMSLYKQEWMKKSLMLMVMDK